MNFISSLFSAPKPPSLPALPPLPTLKDPEVEARRKRVRLAAVKRRGRTATILTGGEGDISLVPVVRPELSKTLG